MDGEYLSEERLEKAATALKGGHREERIRLDNEIFSLMLIGKIKGRSFTRLRGILWREDDGRQLPKASL